MRLDGAARLSGLLLGAGIVAYVLLAVAYAWRLAGYRQEFLADARDPSRALAFFTFTAASDVLAARLAGDGHIVAAAVLMAAGGVGWLLLSYSLPLLLVGAHGPQPALAGANAARASKNLGARGCCRPVGGAVGLRDLADPAAAGGRGVAPPAAPGAASLRAGVVEHRLPGWHVRGGEP